MTRSKDSESRILDLIGQVYDAALDESLWPGTASEIAAGFASTSAALLTAKGGVVRYLSGTTQHDARQRQAYEEYYSRLDVWATGGMAHIGKVVTDQELMDEREFIETEFYQDYVRGMGVAHLVGSVIPVAGDEMAVLGIHRPQTAGRYEDSDKMLVTRFVPHLRRALQIRRRLAVPAIAAGALEDALERSGTAMLLAARSGRILLANRAAERVLQAPGGLNAVGGRVAVSDPWLGDRLKALIRGAADTAAGTGTSAGGAVAIERDERLPLTLLVAPFRPARDGLGATLPVAVVFIRDPEVQIPGASVLQDLFGLTPAEACVASLLSTGRSVDEVAADQHITAGTARTHLKHIFAKTGTSRQAQLVALILTSIAALAG